MNESAHSAEEGTPATDAPLNLPADNLVLFDGECALCTGSVRFLLRHDKQARLHFAALQSPLGQRVCLRHQLNPQDLETFIFARRGKPVLVRSDAALAVASLLGWPWRALGALRILPRPLRDAAYNLVARNRHRWFGRNASCHIPTSAERERFHS